MNKEVLAAHNAKHVDELCEEMDVLGPGLMLSEARIKLSLSVEQVRERLKFRQNLVNEIEQDIFDQSLPATFNRGYLRSYAKLVAVDIDEVLSAYDMLGVAEIRRSEMQSFSNLTEKQVEHSRLMWFSYLMVAILFGLMVLWWLQESRLQVEVRDVQQPITTKLDSVTVESTEPKEVDLDTRLPKAKSIELIASTFEPSTKQKSTAQNSTEHTLIIALEGKAEAEIEQELEPDIGTAVFTFSGDCWVNIYDVTGERIAWGVKKLGYVMSISGKTPLKVTLGKPELAAIVFNGKQVDMSPFNVGNIAKFTLPLISQ